MWSQPRGRASTHLRPVHAWRPDGGYLQVILNFQMLALLGKSVCVSAVSHRDAQTRGQNSRLIDHNKCINMQQGCSLPTPWPLLCS